TRCLSDWSSDVCSSDLRFAGRQSFRKQQIHFFFQEARRGKKLQKNLQPLRVVARLFFQFARRPFNWGFALVHASRHQLPQELPRSEERRVGKEYSAWGA